MTTPPASPDPIRGTPAPDSPLAAAPYQVRRLTEGCANDQLLYFTSNSLTSDDQTLVFISDRDSLIPKADDPRANVNLYAQDRRTGFVRRLTDNREGYLRSYVYFEGQPYRGLGLASPSLHSPSGDLYYLQGREVRCVNACTGIARTLAELPDDHVTGFTHVSDDNTRLCVPTIHESAFQDIGAIDATVQRLGLSSVLRVFDTATGAQVQAVPVERAWITHVQFAPDSSEVILFNHEWPADCGIRRVWLWDGHRIERMRWPDLPQPSGARTLPDDWVCHEVWSRDGQWVLYHGRYVGPIPGASDAPASPPVHPLAGHAFIARVHPDGSYRREIAFAPDFQRYGHFSIGRAVGQLVSDGYAEFPEHPLAALPARGRSGQWISRLDVDWGAGTLHWTPLCRHFSSWTSQDAHPHPIFDHAATEVLFTSDASGQRAIYAVAL